MPSEIETTIDVLTELAATLRQRAQDARKCGRNAVPLFAAARVLSGSVRMLKRINPEAVR